MNSDSTHEILHFHVHRTNNEPRKLSILNKQVTKIYGIENKSNCWQILLDTWKQRNHFLNPSINDTTGILVFDAQTDALCNIWTVWLENVSFCRWNREWIGGSLVALMCWGLESWWLAVWICCDVDESTCLWYYWLMANDCGDVRCVDLTIVDDCGDLFLCLSTDGWWLRWCVAALIYR